MFKCGHNKGAYISVGYKHCRVCALAYSRRRWVEKKAEREVERKKAEDRAPRVRMMDALNYEQWLGLERLRQNSRWEEGWEPIYHEKERWPVGWIKVRERGGRRNWRDSIL